MTDSWQLEHMLNVPFVELDPAANTLPAAFAFEEGSRFSDFIDPTIMILLVPKVLDYLFCQ